jgi:acyl-CoA hydrolase
MKIVKKVEEAVNAQIIPQGSVIYTSGNAATPQVLLRQLAADTTIREVDLLSLLLLGDVGELFFPETCERITHRILFNGPSSREALKSEKATYQMMHLSDIPHQMKAYVKPDVVFIGVAGPDNGGNYSYGTTVEGVKGAVDAALAQGGTIIAERNAAMPFVLGTTIHESDIDFLVDTDYPLPASPVHKPDDTALKIARIITELYIKEGVTLQYGLGEVPEAVSDAIIEKGIKNLGIHTELFADAMRKLVINGNVSNISRDSTFSVATLFLAGDAEGYRWLDFNSSVQSRPSDYTNYIPNIARIPDMVAINSAIGVDLHSNIWADSVNSKQIYSGIGGQSDFLRGSYLSKGGVPIIAMKSKTNNNVSKVMTMSPEGITETAIAADPVVVVTEQGAYNPRGLSMGERAVAIAHLAAPEFRYNLLKYIYDSPGFYKPKGALKETSPKGFVAYDDLF